MRSPGQKKGGQSGERARAQKPDHARVLGPVAENVRC